MELNTDQICKLKKDGLLLQKNDKGEDELIIPSIPITLIGSCELTEDQLQCAAFSLIADLTDGDFVVRIKHGFEPVGPGDFVKSKWWMVKTEKVVFNGRSIWFVGDTGQPIETNEKAPTVFLLHKKGGVVELVPYNDTMKLQVQQAPRR